MPLPASLTVIDLAVLALVGVAMPAFVIISDLTSAKDTPRPRLYRRAMAMLWGITAIVLTAWIAQGRNLVELGFGPPSTLVNWLVAGAAVAGCIFLGLQVLSVARSDQARATVRASLDKSAGVNDIMPQTPREHRLFYGLSITAGITEEILFRGFLIWGFSAFMPLWAAAAVSLVIFVASHAYQRSVENFLKVTVMGLILTAVAIFSGSLWPAILLHAVVDITSNATVWLARKDTRSEEALAPA